MVFVTGQEYFWLGLFSDLGVRAWPSVLGGRLRHAPFQAGLAPVPVQALTDCFSLANPKQVMQFALAGSADLPDIVRLNNQTFPQRLTVMACRLLQSLGEKIYVMRDLQGVSQPIAMVRLKLVRQCSGELTGLIYNLAVVESYRGKGVASALIREVQTQARQQGMKQLVLSAKPGLQSFYEGLGFRRAENQQSLVRVAQGHLTFSLDL